MTGQGSRWNGSTCYKDRVNPTMYLLPVHGRVTRNRYQDRPHSEALPCVFRDRILLLYPLRQFYQNHLVPYSSNIKNLYSRG